MLTRPPTWKLMQPMLARLTIAPPLPSSSNCRSITGSTCLQPRKALLRLRSICASHAPSGMETGSPGALPPTLLTRMSTPAEPGDAFGHCVPDVIRARHVADARAPVFVALVAHHG